MKTSKVKIYVENTEVPEYKTSGASGFDIKVLFNNKIPYITIDELSDLCGKDISDCISWIYQLYMNSYSFYEKKVITLDSFINAIKALPHVLKDYFDYGYNLIDYLNQNNIKYVNIIPPFKTATFPTGLHFELPEEDELQIRTRSGIASKTLLSVKLGTIDTDWRGNTAVIVQNISPYAYIVIPGMRLAQGVIIEKKHAEFERVNSIEDLSKTERGDKGLGSTGTK